MPSYDVDVYQRFRVTPEEVAHFTANDIGFYGVDASRISQFLKIQLTAFSKHGPYCSANLTGVIQGLEGVEGNCPPQTDAFRHAPLKGLWKAHFFDPMFMVKNLFNHWGVHSQKNKKFDRLVQQVQQEESLHTSKVGWQGRFAHAFVGDGLNARSKQSKGLTGEWLIYAKHQGQNYYLCAAKHTTPNSHEERQLHSFISAVLKEEFPHVTVNA